MFFFQIVIRVNSVTGLFLIFYLFLSQVTAGVPLKKEYTEEVRVENYSDPVNHWLAAESQSGNRLSASGLLEKCSSNNLMGGGRDKTHSVNSPILRKDGCRLSVWAVIRAGVMVSST